VSQDEIKIPLPHIKFNSQVELFDERSLEYVNIQTGNFVKRPIKLLFKETVWYFKLCRKSIDLSHS